MRGCGVLTRQNGPPVRLARIACGAGAYLGGECGRAAWRSGLAGNNLNRFAPHRYRMMIAFDGPGHLDEASVIRADQHAYSVGFRLSGSIAVAARVAGIAATAQRVRFNFRVRTGGATARIQIPERRGRRRRIARRQRRNE